MPMPTAGGIVTDSLSMDDAAPAHLHPRAASISSCSRRRELQELDACATKQATSGTGVHGGRGKRRGNRPRWPRRGILGVLACPQLREMQGSAGSSPIFFDSGRRRGRLRPDPRAPPDRCSAEEDCRDRGQGSQAGSS
jgi:hypothetical protein